MKIDIISILREEFPDFLDNQNEFVLDNMKEFQNSEIHLKNMQELSLTENDHIERTLLKEILKCISEMGYDSSCEYFAAITKRFSAYVRDGSKKVIVIDDLFKSGLIDLYILVLSWANDINNTDTFEYCFLNMLYLLDMRCVKKSVGTISHEQDRKWFRKLDENILNIASNCYWVSLCFMISHEIGHLVLGHTEVAYNTNHEYEADKFAFNVIVHLIKKHRQSKDDILSVFTEYTCFSPMMLLDFYRMINLYQNLIYPKIDQHFKPDPQNRINRLLDIGIDEFDINEGNTVYCNYLDVLDKFTEQLNIKYNRGKLDVLPHIEAD